MQSTRTLPVVAKGSTRLRQLSPSTLALYWNGSIAVAILAIALTAVRVGEQLGPARYLKPVFSATLIGVVLHLVRTHSVAWGRLWRSTSMRLVLLYCLIIVFSFPFSIWRGQTWATLQVLPWGLGLVIIIGLTKPTIQSLDIVSRWTGWLTAVAATLLLVKGEVVEGSRLTSSGSYDPNDLAALFALTLPFAIGSTLRGKFLYRCCSLIAAVVLLIALMKTGSRGGLVGFVVGIAVMIFSFRPRVVVGAIVALMIIVPLSIPLLPSTMRARAATLVSLEDDYNTTSSSGRIYLWKRGLVFAMENPVLGLGAGSFEAQIGNDFRAQQTTGAWHTAHNTYVQVAAELGFAGIGCLLFLMWKHIRRSARLASWKAEYHRPEYLASLVAYLTCIVFLSHAYSYILFAVLGLGVLLESVAYTQTNATHQTSAHNSPRRMSRRLRQVSFDRRVRS